MNERQASLLLIDDEEPNRVLITRRLLDIGHRVTSAASGRDGLELMRAERFDLVLLDLQMPDLDGLATLDLIKSNPALDAVPVIMLTASRTREAVVHCLTLGAADYVIKPVVPAELRRRVQAALDKSARPP